ncbi:MAG: DNA polymerase III subunit alpha [Acidobacteria bacterium]|nr:DNA polymerase III subunit alpha [Acidobacteriota bacterium]
MLPELHARSAFSFLEAASTPEDLIEECARLGIPSLAQLDTDNVAGAPRLYMAAKKTGIRAHAGAEITAEGGGRYALIAENRTGYQNLCRLITSMKLRAPKGKAAASEEELRRFSTGLICVTRGGHDPGLLLDIYGRHGVYAELQRHFHRGEEARNQRLLDLAARWKLPLTASNGVRYARREQRELMDVLTCVRNKTTIHAAGRRLEPNAERHLKPEREMQRLFADLPEALDGARALAQRLQFTLADLGYKFPPYPVPPGETMNSFLRGKAWEGAGLRYRPLHDKAQRQIERELALIEKLDLAGYFLIVWDLVQFCRANQILVQGRGSAANSAVCYSLGITAVDPVGMDLLFERFLSEERGEWPDIDLDLPSGDQRERVIQHVYRRYGERGAAMTANVITYRGRSGIRDVGKVLGFPEGDLGRLSALVSRWGFKNPEEGLDRNFREAGYDPSDPRIGKFLQLYKDIQDLPRHLGQHSGGMVVCQGALDSVVPIEPATMPGRVVIQWDKEDCADLGLIKVDLLGLGMLAAIEETLDTIRTVHGEEVDLAHLPQDDPAVYGALQRADTVGLFQVESRAQMSVLPRMRPEKFYDIVVQVAIIRPGPIVGKMLHPYMRRREGTERPDSLHPMLDPVLARTRGVPLFQEQLLRMAMTAANFTGGEAEDLRRAMGFKRSQARMAQIEEKLRSGMAANGIHGETQDRIVQSITSFALYGFPESHAASFALIAYASAYLKCHYLAAFTAALLNNQPMGFYHPSTLVKDAQRHGLRVLPVDVTDSEWLCAVQDRGTMRLGFNYVRGLRKPTADAIIAARRAAAFESIEDLTRRVPGLHKDELRMLAQIGALNFIGARTSDRRTALWQSELALRPAGPLLDPVEAGGPGSPLAMMTDRERIHADFHGTGLTVGRHPIQLHRPYLDARGVIPAGELVHTRHGRIVRIAGCVICRQRPETAHGFAFFSLEDETGIANAIVSPKMFEVNRLVLISAPYLLLEGVLQNLQGAASVKVGRVEALDFGDMTVESHDFH